MRKLKMLGCAAAVMALISPGTSAQEWNKTNGGS